MAIYRGTGGSGDATVDATNTAAVAIAAAASATLSQNAANTSAITSNISAVNAAASAVLAQNAAISIGFNLTTNNNWSGINTVLTAVPSTYQPVPINQADARYLGISANAISATNAATLSSTLVVASGGTGTTTSTGTGSVVLNNSPILVTPALGTPTSGALDNCTSNTETAGNNTTQLATTAFATTADNLKANLAGLNTFTGGINLARSSVVQNATTMDLWALANTIDGTGSAVILTAIANAPQAGAIRTLYPITSTVIVNNAMFAVNGGANYTIQAGDKVEFEAITISTYKVHITKANGAAMAGAGEYFYWPIGSTPAYGLSCNGAAVSRTVYQVLFGSIGTNFGVGDGSTTFNIPNIPADYSFVQASANETSSTVGQVLAHTHGILQYQATGGGASAASATASSAVTTTTSAQTPAGGVANFAAGVRARVCIRF